MPTTPRTTPLPLEQPYEVTMSPVDVEADVDVLPALHFGRLCVCVCACVCVFCVCCVVTFIQRDDLGKKHVFTTRLVGGLGTFCVHPNLRTLAYRPLMLAQPRGGRGGGQKFGTEHGQGDPGRAMTLRVPRYQKSTYRHISVSSFKGPR